MAGLADYPALHYFMQAYWNQMGDLVHGTVAKAVNEFCAGESDDYQRRLFEYLQRADQAGMLLDEPDWDDGRQVAFWGGRCLTKSDLADAQIAMAGAGPRQ